MQSQTWIRLLHYGVADIQPNPHLDTHVWQPRINAYRLAAADEYNDGYLR